MTTINVNIAKADKCNSELSLYISCAYDNNFLAWVRPLPDRNWDGASKQWEVPFAKLQELTERFSDYQFSISADSYITAEKPEAKIPADFSFKTQPFEHQIEGFNYGLQNNKWLLGDEMGLGKTKQVIDIAVAKKLQKNYKHCLIICGVNGLKWNWRNEVAVHSNETAYILGQKVKAGRVTIGSNADKKSDIANLAKNDNYFIITNVESLRDEEIYTALSNACKSGLIGMIAFDECHKAKNPTSQQGKGVLALCADTMIAMTGTPLMNTPLDLYIILKWLGYEKHSFYSFRQHHCIMGGYGGYEVMGYKNMDELQNKLDSIMLRRLKEDVLDLPEKTYINEYVDMTPKQAQIYKEVTAEIKANIDQIKMASNPLAQLIRMRQATGYTGILSSSIKESAKLDRMEELVEEAVENGKKVVIFSNWTQMTDVIRARLAKLYKGVVITGQTADEERQVNVNHFQNNPECKYIIGTTGAMGTGLTLTAGTVIIFMDHPWNMALYEQCVDRCHRIGQKNNLTIYNLMCQNTIDERIWEIVKEKGELADSIVDGKDITNKSELIDFLIG